MKITMNVEYIQSGATQKTNISKGNIQNIFNIMHPSAQVKPTATHYILQ
jgi:hypothetical protein